ncbi:lytic murein transglycosylase [Sphingomonas crocodyli]|nr:lytic murein transglycosylase [Sphingomonas crocodyli]
MGLKKASIAAMICWLVASPGDAQPVSDQPDPSTVIAGDASTDDAAQVVDAPAPVVPAQDIALQNFIRTLRSKAIERGVSGNVFDAVVPTLTYNDRVIRLDRGQPGSSSSSSASPDFAPYLASHVDATRINMGRSRYGRLRPLLASIETKTGVPEQIMLAIYGHETGYGTFTGNFDLLRSLATLAFEGRRRDLFAAEYIDTLLLLQRGIPRETLKGSWAGATGYPQFLPSVYLRLGIDGDNDGRVDIWRSEPDALASIGNYLSDAGWKPGAPWGVAVRVPDGFDRGAVSPLMSSPRCPRVHARHSRWLTVTEWRQKGLMMLGSRIPADDELTMLIEPDGPGRTAYLLTSNYRSILDYNCSNYYALSVGLLGDAVGN